MKWKGNRRRWLRRMAVLGAGVGLYAWRIEPHWVEWKRRSLAVPNLPPDWEGRSLIQLSDIHAGPFVDDAFLVENFSRVARENPDLVFYTGDFVSRGWTLSDERLISVYQSAPKGRMGTFGVLGNHDYGRNWSDGPLANRLTQVLESVGIQLLRNETVNREGLRIHGVDDLWGLRFDVESTRENIVSDQPHLVLCHNPDVADLPVWGDHPCWIFSGHTHGGQCRVPWLTSMILPVQNTRYRAGEFSVGFGRRLYVNRGLGHLLRLRFAARPEITHFQLKRDIPNG